MQNAFVSRFELFSSECANLSCVNVKQESSVRLSTFSITLKLIVMEAKWSLYIIVLLDLQRSIITVYYVTCKTALKLIFSLVKIDRLLMLYCYWYNRAHQASVLLLVELFSIQKHVISQHLHFFGGREKL